MRLLILGSALLVSLGTAPSAMAWTWPLGGPVLRPYSLGPDAYAAGQHRGVDVGGTDGELVRAPASGTVSFVGVVPSSGKTVTIQLEGYAVSLTHLGATSIGKGASVTEGDPVGTAGASGETEWPTPYVHLGVRVSSAADGYVDPLTLLPPRTVAPPPAAPPAASAPSTAPVVNAGSDVPVARAEPTPPRAEALTPEVRTPELRLPGLQTPEPRSTESQTSQAPAQKQGSPKASWPQPVGTRTDSVQMPASGKLTGTTAISTAADPVAPPVRDSHTGEDPGRAAIPGRTPSPAAATEPTAGGSQPGSTIGPAGPEVPSGLPAGSTTVNAVRPVSPPVASAPTSTEIQPEDRTHVDGVRAGSAVTPTRVEANLWHPAAEQAIPAGPPVQTNAASRPEVGGRTEGSAPKQHGRGQPSSAEAARQRMPAAVVRDEHPVARVRVWLTTALLLLLVAVGGGRWLVGRDRSVGGRGAVLHHDVRLP